MVTPEQIGVILFLVYGAAALWMLRLKGRLDAREANLEHYAGQLEDWDTSLKVKAGALGATLRLVRRMGALDPVLKEKADAAAELWKEKPLCAPDPDCVSCEIEVDCGGQDNRAGR
jgi:hypothetical protein